MSKRKQQTLGRLQFECDAFNMHVKVGDAVDVHEDDGRITRTTTRSEAQVLGDHTAVVWLADRAGCFLLGRVTLANGATGDK